MTAAAPAAAQALSPEDVYALSPLLARVLVADGAPEALADDIVADVVEWAVRHGGMPSKAYAKSAAKHALASHFRSPRSRTVPLYRPAESGGELPLPLPVDHRPAEEAVEARIVVAGLLEAVELSPRQREALVLHHLEALDWDEVGAAMGCGRDRARYYGKAALGRLRAAAEGLS